MRYYTISISDPNTGRVWTTLQSGSFVLGDSTTGATFSSLANGATNPQVGANNPYAQNVEIDLPIVPMHTPQGKAVVRVWGVGIQQISQAANLNGQNFSLSAGMSPGLPLVSPPARLATQNGLLVTGQVFQAFGNWQGVNMTLDLIVYPGATGSDQNISWNWKAGTQISSALAQTFAQAFPQYKAIVKVGNIALPNDDLAAHQSLSAFAEHVWEISTQYGNAAYGENYPGINISIQGNTIIATDAVGGPVGNPVALSFSDLIGQPTWIAPTTISFKTVMRADINIGTFVTFPSGIVSPYALTSDAAAYPNVPARNKAVFQGTFFVNEAHCFGNFRQPDADSWVTAYTAIPTNQ